jgi:predicted nucleic-acid-binding protein
MIGIDSNVLVRIFVRDDPHQTAAAVRFLGTRTSDDPAFVSAVVVAELVWALERTYRYTSAAIHEALDSLFESTNIMIEKEALMGAAVAVAAQQNADISDSIIAAIAADAGASHTVTFDKPAAKRVPGMELLK